MTIENEAKTRRINVTCVSAEKDVYPSYQLKIDILTEEFWGKFDRAIWVEEDMIKDFTDQLASLEQSRNGDVKLESMSPSEFSLRFHNADQLGHLLVEVQIQKNGADLYADFIRLEFEIDPTSLPRIISEWIKIINES